MPQLLISILFLLLGSTAWAQFGAGKPKTKFSAVSEVKTVAAGEEFQIAFNFKHLPDHHSYYVNPGTIGKSLSITWTLPDGFKASDVDYPIPHISKTKQGDSTILSYGYEGDVTYLFTITPPADLPSSQDLTLSGKIDSLVCNATGCFPENHNFSLTLPSADSSEKDPAQAALFAAARKAYPTNPDGWEIEIETDKNVIDGVWLKLTPPAGVTISEPVYFFSADGQIDSQATQYPDVEGNQYTLPLDRNLGNDDLSIEAVEAKESLPGIFVYHTADGTEAAIKIGKAQTKIPEVENHAAFILATEEEKTAGLALYDPDARPDFVLLGGKKEAPITFWSALGLVFIGGLLLNLMPCVFPVLGLKVMSFVSLAGEDDSKIKKHGLVFGLGLLVTMWILASIIIAIDFNWGQQLSNPVFLGSIIILLFLMGLNLFGLFEFGTKMTSVGGELQAKKGYSGSFFSGALTTLIATPCSGPFLGAVMGYALSQPNSIALVIFTVFALGIASPYILLSFFPKLIKKLPRPGAWMESFKQIMSFLLFATVAFFLKSYLGLVGADAFNVFIFALVSIALGAYIYGRWGTVATKVKTRYITGFGLAAVFGIGGIVLALQYAEKDANKTTTAHKIGGLAWHEWFPGKMELTRKKKRIAWIDYTADW